MSSSFGSQIEQINLTLSEPGAYKKCPNCDTTIVFNLATGLMHCDYCGQNHRRTAFSVKIMARPIVIFPIFDPRKLTQKVL